MREVFYDALSKTAVVSFQLPLPEDLPREIGCKYIKTRMAAEPILMNKKDLPVFYENIIHQIALKVIYELFKAAYVKDMLETIVFNGWIRSVDKSTGRDFEACILSVQTNRKEFRKINLKRVAPKECLRGLKALSAGPLCNLAPVRPIMDINRKDKRFVASADVLKGLTADANLATRPWDEFEHLVRELFGKHFSQDGAEVRVTQASRDGGVDAIAFDPDPIRGGKYVIQAKRYNNVVPVSACRDLYGTMINEGAVKGILVTTSYYGPDSRDFVKDKPITLIDGANLVYMLNEYGYNFRINLKEQSQ
jgi:restriction system protein